MDNRPQPLPFRVRRKRPRSPLLLFYIVPFFLIASVIVLAIVLWAPSEAIWARLSFLPDNATESAEEFEGAEEWEDPDAVRIYLTFDDGPSSQSTPAILDTLEAYNIKATFFIMGRAAEAMPDMVRRQYEKGHVIANHSYSHDYDRIYGSSAAFMQDLEQCEQVFTDILGVAPVRLLRFPAGSAAIQLEHAPATREAIKDSLRSGGWRYFDWNVSIGDSISGWVPPVGELGGNLIERIEEQVHHGATDIIVLAHDVDSKPWTPKDLPMVIEHCIAQGYVFKTLTYQSPAVEFR